MWPVLAVALAAAPASFSFTPPAWPLPPEKHPLVVNMPPRFEEDIASVGQYIADHEPNPYQRVKALHDYVATRLRYAIEEYESGRVEQKHADPKTVFKTRKAVCAGYARLMEALGRAAGVEVRYVVGLVRVYEPKTRTVEVSEHAWNAARIDGRWLNIDATWDFGTAGDGKVRLAYSTEWLFTPDDVFAFTHLASKEYPELRPAGLTEAAFRARPLLRPRFFAHGVQLVSPATLTTAVARRVELSIDNPARAAVTARVHATDGKAFALCYPTHCGDVACGAGQVCVHDSCVERSCLAGLCADGQRCRAAQCVTVSCRQDSDCAPTERCGGGVCRGVNPFGDTAESARTLELTCELPGPGRYAVRLSTRGAGDLRPGSYWETGTLFVESAN